MARPYPLTYPGFAYRQTDSEEAPWLVLFVASAEELLSWAAIPRRTEGVSMGFQRVDNPDRVQRTKDFFNLPPNQSPTALILGIHPKSETVKLELGEAQPDAPFRPCVLRVLNNPSDIPLNTAVDVVRSQLSMRLTGNAVTNSHIEEPSEDADDEEVSEEGDEVPEEEGIELTHSLLHRLRAQLDDQAWVDQNRDAILDLAKPATIIDGQHRIKGAAMCERGIPFAVCALFDCAWPEQVFQFTVVNYKAEGIPDQFITANAALSLSEPELWALEGRLIQARVKVIEYELMKVVQFDHESPFYNLVNLSEGKDATKIGYKTMVRVAKDWYSATAQVLKASVLPQLMPSIKGKAARLQYWQEELWGQFFIDFWRTVRDFYQPHQTAQGQTLWSTGSSNLMIAIVLYEFQRMFFRDLNNQDEEFFSVPHGEEPIAFLRSKLRQRAQKFVSYFPPEFFTLHWETKSLNTSMGRKALQTAFQKLLDSKGKYQYARSALVTGETG